MKVFLSFVIKETKHIFRDKRTMLILFGIPIVLMLLFGFAMRTDVRNVRTVAVTTSMDQLTQKCIDALDASEYFSIVATANTPQEAERILRNQQADMAVVFSSNFASEAGQGNAAVQLIIDASDPNMAQQYEAYLSEELRMKREELVAANGSLIGNSSRFTIHSSLLYNPRMESSYNFVPGILGMLLLLICALMTSISIVKEKERGTMEVLLVSPLRPWLIVVSKAIPYMLLSFVVLSVILLMARYVLMVPVSGGLGWIYLVSLLYILLSLSLGLLISTIAQTQVIALLFSAIVLLIPTLMLSGLIFPVESMPRILQWISAIVPANYYISAMRKLMIMGVDIGVCGKEVFVLLGMTTLLMALAIKNFKNRLS